MLYRVIVRSLLRYHHRIIAPLLYRLSINDFIPSNRYSLDDEKIVESFFNVNNDN